MDIAHFYLDGNTDSVEFCPYDSYSHVLAASTYMLQEGDNPSRSGSIVLFTLNAGSCQLDLLNCLESNSIFDIKWSPVEANTGRPLLAQADSDGCVKVHGLESSLDGQQEKGSDDCKFCRWDVHDCPSKLVFHNSKEHKMGVCCITKSITDPNVVLTGSYDEHIRVWDIRSISKPVSRSSICLGGGVWRIKLHSHVPGLVLAACMHNGFSFVDLWGEEIKIAETYNRHSSLAYGADWQKVCQ